MTLAWNGQPLLLRCIGFNACICLETLWRFVVTDLSTTTTFARLAHFATLLVNVAAAWTASKGQQAAGGLTCMRTHLQQGDGNGCRIMVVKAFSMAFNILRHLVSMVINCLALSRAYKYSKCPHVLVHVWQPH